MYYINLAVSFLFEFDTRSFKKKQNYQGGKKERRRETEDRRKEIPPSYHAPSVQKNCVLFFFK